MEPFFPQARRQKATPKFKPCMQHQPMLFGLAAQQGVDGGKGQAGPLGLGLQRGQGSCRMVMAGGLVRKSCRKSEEPGEGSVLRRAGSYQAKSK